MLGACQDLVVVRFALFAPQSSGTRSTPDWFGSSAAHPSARRARSLPLSGVRSPSPSQPLGSSPDDAALSGILAETNVV